MTPRPLDYRIDAGRHEVWIGSKQVNLAPKEFDILLLLKKEGVTLSREAITAAVWTSTPPEDSRVIDQHITRLRRKMLPTRPIITVPTKGYKIA